MNPDGAEFRIRVKDTPKSIMLTFIDNSFRYTDGHLEMLFGLSLGEPRDGIRTVRIPKNKPCPHAMRFSDYSDDWFVIYPYRGGVPFVFDFTNTE